MAIGRYSKYIRPISYGIDLAIVVGLLFYFVSTVTLGIKSAILLAFIWVYLSQYTGFYEVFRFTNEIQILSKLVRQLLVFSLCVLALIFFIRKHIETVFIIQYLTGVAVLISFFKFFIYFVLKKYREWLGGNYRRVIVIGTSDKINALVDFFKVNSNFGYKMIYNFDNNTTINEIASFVLKNNIDELYCDLNSVKKNMTTDLIDFAHSNFKTIKLLPDNSALSHNMFIDYYEYIPVISIRKTPLELTFNYFLKRFFDLAFSTLIIILVLSWLTPLIYIILKLDSKGPLFFKQKRNGLNNKEFSCYKFRSMVVNSTADIELASKDDIRITKFGKFIRKTSLDEMPQFFNVFFGDMSVVGPRPHMLSVNEDYALRFDKFMERHYIKPGVTGLAQVKGYRGEVKFDSDITNRLKFDLYYIENWSILLDIKIIFITIKNFVSGDEKAY